MSAIFTRPRPIAGSKSAQHADAQIMGQHPGPSTNKFGPDSSGRCFLDGVYANLLAVNRNNLDLLGSS
jgi:hypothetical protein